MVYDRINIEEALDQLGGSDKLYKTLVSGFYKKYQSVDVSIEDLVDQNEMEDARRLAHSIKGLSGNLGARRLREKAMNLEYAIRDNTADIKVCITYFSDELKAVIIEVEDLLNTRYKDKVESEARIEPGEDGFIASCKELLSALETYKYSEVKVAFKQFNTIKVIRTYKNEVEEVRRYVEDYDYDLAINVLKRLITE